MEAKNILDFDVWKKSNKSSVKNHQVLALDSELRRARKTVKNCSKALASATEIVQSIYKSFEGYEAFYRFPVAVLGRASDVIETCGKVNSDTESCMGVLGSLDVPSGSSLNSEEVSVLKKLRENKLSLRILLLQVQSKTHVQETFMINTIAAHAQRRLDELNKAVERYCGDLSIKDTNSDYSLQSDLCEKLSELEDMHLDWRAGRNQPWSDVQGRKKRMIRTLIVLIDAESGLRSRLDALGARGGGIAWSAKQTTSYGHPHVVMFAAKLAGAIGSRRAKPALCAGEQWVDGSYGICYNMKRGLGTRIVW
eukprot:CAMPEP_0184752150 /NCGR_PEP_ID=MMETSP0315-20130426/43427_1 /TAXON_ID=101924 /ORGANISM="Rhodosorus marinus, Strain UTEX LB 2760" /LENGTH=308 /DNA_ID=CAMNT_0027231467 /DNA_START=859 /DNA_END=1783 /DNA_ORIENTATION=+